MILVNKINTKQVSKNIIKIKHKMKAIKKAPLVITADSKEQKTIPADYLPSRLLNEIMSKYSEFIPQSKTTKGRLGNWIVFSLQDNQKRLEIITIYRILISLLNRLSYSLTQYNRIDGRINSVTLC